MKVLITGANGQLGSEIKARSEQFPGIDFLLTDVDELDLTDFEAVRAFIEEHKPSFIINCAAYTAVDVAETDVELASLINTKVPAFLGKLATAIDAKVVHVSTDYVFDGTACTPYEEADLVDPDSVYGKTKLNGEIALVKENPKAIIIRTSWLYSSYGKNFAKTMIKLGIERDELKVVVDQVGTPTYAGDLADAILMIIDKALADAASWKGGIYHFSNEGVCSWYDFAKAIHEIYGIDCNVRPISTDEYPTPAKRPAYSVLCKKKIKRNYGITIPYWRDSLKDCIAQLKAQH
ncbi:dTDP-4-dehydrorhamnose reductase [Mangrovibacterium marinum]|uniref:dTDP-4-dehydrorhamnose reductase n=1 Tax=Mangrovibacterium marinum TaxID=1639118 RepID=A0A2T5BY55_9BACT|nr:dTDP-4-dehydrorhamnose reductase [Mangrovibacterium marinum]PTN06326.1 dTDP-4-dehydrorhamnose reductase [Mangrovibacterium marinum]